MARTLPDQNTSAPLPTKPLALVNVASLAGGATPEASLLARMRAAQSGPGYAAGGMVKPTFFGDRPPPPSTPLMYDNTPARPIPPRVPMPTKPVGGLPGGASQFIQPPEYPQVRVRPAEPAPTPVGTYPGVTGVVDALRNRKVKNAEAADYADGGMVESEDEDENRCVIQISIGDGKSKPKPKASYACGGMIKPGRKKGFAAGGPVFRDGNTFSDRPLTPEPSGRPQRIANPRPMPVPVAVPPPVRVSLPSPEYPQERVRPVPVDSGPPPDTYIGLPGVVDALRNRKVKNAEAADYACGGAVKKRGMAGGGMVRFAGKGGPRDDQIPVKVAGAEINVSDGENAVILPAKTAANPAAIQAIEGIIQATNDGRQPKAGIEDGGEYQVGSYPYDGKRPPTAQEVYAPTYAAPGSLISALPEGGYLRTPEGRTQVMDALSGKGLRPDVGILGPRNAAPIAQEPPQTAARSSGAEPFRATGRPGAFAVYGESGSPAPAAPAMEVPEPAGDRGMPPVEPRSLGTFTYKGKTVNVPEEGPTGVPRMDSAPVRGPQIMSISPGRGGGMPPAGGPVDAYGNSTALTTQLKGQLADVMAAKQAEQAQSDKLTEKSNAWQQEVRDRQQAERNKWEREVAASSILNRPDSADGRMRAQATLAALNQQAEAEAMRNRGMLRGQDVQERIAGQKSEADMRQAQLRAQTDLGTTGMRVGGELASTGMRNASAERMNAETVNERKAAAAAHDTALKEIARANREGTEPKAYEVKNAAGQTTHLVQFFRDANGQWQPRRIPVMDQPKA